MRRCNSLAKSTVCRKWGVFRLCYSEAKKAKEGALVCSVFLSGAFSSLNSSSRPPDLIRKRQLDSGAEEAGRSGRLVLSWVKLESLIDAALKDRPTSRTDVHLERSQERLASAEG